MTLTPCLQTYKYFDHSCIDLLQNVLPEACDPNHPPQIQLDPSDVVVPNTVVALPDQNPIPSILVPRYPKLELVAQHVILLHTNDHEDDIDEKDLVDITTNEVPNISTTPISWMDEPDPAIEFKLR